MTKHIEHSLNQDKMHILMPEHVGFIDSKLNPMQRKPLTDEEINSVCYKRDWTAPWTNTTFARAIEAAHGIKE